MYVGREKELNELVREFNLQHPRHAIIYGGPGIGKTSLIRRLDLRLRADSLHLYLIPLGAEVIQSEESFYTYIARELVRRQGLQDALGQSVIASAGRFQDLLRGIRIPHTCIVVLEQLTNVPETVLKSLANMLRNMWETSDEADNEVFRQFLFILTGGSELFRAVGGTTVSPLKEVALNITLKDLSKEESNILLHTGLSEAHFPEENIPRLCDEIYACLHGHPYLTQCLGDKVVQCYLEEGILCDGEFVKQQAMALVNDYTKFIPLLNQVQKEGLLDTLKAILDPSRQLPFSMGQPAIALLHMIGFIREEDGHCVIRNCAYAQRLVRELAHLPSSSASQRRTGSRQIIPLSQASRQLFRIELSQLRDGEFRIRATNPRGGPIYTDSRLPYTPTELIAVLKALLPYFREQNPFLDQQIGDLQRRELWHIPTGLPVVNVEKKVGQVLYQALMVDEVGRVFEDVLGNKPIEEHPLTLQLSINFDAVELALYPWELLYHQFRDSLLLKKDVELVRRVISPLNTKQFQHITPPLRVLYIGSRPVDAPVLLGNEQQVVLKELEGLSTKHRDDFEFTSLDPRTFTALLHYLENNVVHVLHFDGHGSFGRLCSRCKTVTRPPYTICQGILPTGQQCNFNIADVQVKGHLAFENEVGERDPIDSETLGNLLSQREIRLVILSSCDSSTLDNSPSGASTLFEGTAQALVKSGVMAVIATQSVISTQGAANFIQSFYRALIRPNTIVTAVNAARQALMYPLDKNEWFIPTLYAHTDDHELALFQDE